MRLKADVLYSQKYTTQSKEWRRIRKRTKSRNQFGSEEMVCIMFVETNHCVFCHRLRTSDSENDNDLNVVLRGRYMGGS